MSRLIATILLAILMRISDTTAQRLGEVAPRKPSRRQRRRAAAAGNDATTVIEVSR
mgnify:CR=1 FL=1